MLIAANKKKWLKICISGINLYFINLLIYGKKIYIYFTLSKMHFYVIWKKKITNYSKLLHNYSIII